MRQTPVILVTLLLAVAASATLARAAESDPIRRSGYSAVPTTQTAAAASDATSTSGAARVGFALVAIVGLIFALKWGGEKFFGSSFGNRPSRAVQLLSRNPVGPKQAVLLMHVGRRVLVVADSAGSMTRLTELTDPDEVAELVGQVRQEKADSATRTFGSLFKSAEDSFDPQDDKNAGQEAAVVTDDTSVNNEPLEMRDELAGLTSRIRSLSRQLGRADA